MARYGYYTSAMNLFDAVTGQPVKQTLAWVSRSSFIVKNSDNSYTVFAGNNLAWNASTGAFTAGTVTSVTHVSGWTIVDSLSNVSIAARDVQSALEGSGAPEKLRALAFSGNDLMDATRRSVATLMIGYGGHDTMLGGSARDELYSGSGLDRLEGRSGDDFLNGGLDDDKLFGNDGTDRLIGDGGSDSLDGGSGDDLLFGGAGDDTYIGGDGLDTLIYTRSFGDLVFVTADGTKITEPNGRDSLSGIERLATDEGVFEWSSATSSWQKISDVPGAELLRPGTAIRGTTAGETLSLGMPGKDIILAGDGNDRVTGATAWDLLMGGFGNDTISGNGGGDRLYGEAGDDSLTGGEGNDMLYGGDGADTLSAGNGFDTMTGGVGSDLFVFRSGTFAGVQESWSNDLINDFQVGLDHLRLEFSSASSTPSLTKAAAGWLVSLDGVGSILLKGVHDATLTLDELLA